MAVTLFLCEATGARILATNTGLTQTGTDFQGDLTTWDLTPMGEVGDSSFRTVDVSGTMTNGFTIGVTPIIDGANLPEQTFGGSGTGEWTAQCFIAQRGARIAARVRTLGRNGVIEVHNVSCSFYPIRRIP